MAMRDWRVAVRWETFAFRDQNCLSAVTLCGILLLLGLALVVGEHLLELLFELLTEGFEDAKPPPPDSTPGGAPTRWAGEPNRHGE